MTQRVARCFVFSAQVVHIKNVFPGTSAQRTRFDLAQADVPQRENTERFEQRSRKVLHFECDGGLVGASYDLPPPMNQKEAREVAFVVLDAGLQYLPAINAGGLPSRNSRCMLQLVFDHMLHAARRVIKRQGLDPGMFPEKITALLKRHRMGEYALDSLHPDSRRCDQVMHDAQAELPLHEKVAR